MTLHTPEADVREAGERIRRANVAFVKLFEALEDLTERAEDGDTSVLNKVRTLSSDVGRALNTINEVEAKLDAIRRKNAGIVYDSALDLDEARSEIWGRLDRIEDAGRTQCISRRSE